MKAGKLVSDETVLNLVRERVGCMKCSGGFLLDGFSCVEIEVCRCRGGVAAGALLASSARSGSSGPSSGMSR